MSLMALTRLTLYLLGEEVAEPAQALNRHKTPSSVELSPDCGFEGVFYYESRPATPPAWVTFVGPLLTALPPRLLSASASGLLILKARQRLFAITFGHGRGFLDLSRIEHRFGLRVALNRIDPSQIRSLDTKTFEDMVVTRNTQVSRSSELPAFGVDISRDILRAVTGEPRDKSLAKRLSGADALVVNVEIASSALSTLCAELLAAYQEDSYKENFAWIDHLGLVVDPAVRDALDEQLVEQLRVGDTSSTHMVMPEAIGWEDIDTFKITGTPSVEYDDLDLDAYLAQLGVKRADLTLENMKSRRVSIRFSPIPASSTRGGHCANVSSASSGSIRASTFLSKVVGFPSATRWSRRSTRLPLPFRPVLCRCSTPIREKPSASTTRGSPTPTNHGSYCWTRR
jgi:uncharacterized protein (TIGR04141 family)